MKLQLLELNDLQEFVPEFLLFRVTVIAIILHSCRNYCDKATRKGCGGLQPSEFVGPTFSLGLIRPAGQPAKRFVGSQLFPSWRRSWSPSTLRRYSRGISSSTCSNETYARIRQTERCRVPPWRIFSTSVVTAWYATAVSTRRLAGFLACA